MIFILDKHLIALPPSLLGRQILFQLNNRQKRIVVFPPEFCLCKVKLREDKFWNSITTHNVVCHCAGHNLNQNGSTCMGNEVLIPSFDLKCDLLNKWLEPIYSPLTSEERNAKISEAIWHPTRM